MLRYFFHAIQGLIDFLVTLKKERYGYDANGQDVHGLGLTGNNRCSTGSGSATHSGCDKHHLGAIVQHVADVLNAFLSSFAGSGRTVAGSQTFLAQLQAHRNVRITQCLTVCVAQNEVNIVYTLFVHVVNGIAATAAHTYDFDDGRRRCGNVHLDEHVARIKFCHDTYDFSVWLHLILFRFVVFLLLRAVERRGVLITDQRSNF